MIFPDYHLHTLFSSDCDSDVDSVISAARAKGMQHICITDHYDMDYPVNPKAPDLTFNLDECTYYNYMDNCKSNLKDFELHIGIELGVTKDNIAGLNAFAGNKDRYDFFIASSHLVDNMDPYYGDYFCDKTDYEAYAGYFETILHNVKNFKHYNVYGHLDYILRYGKSKAADFKASDYYDIFKEIFDIIIHDGKGIEINTGGLYKGLGFCHPHSDILKMYKEAGGEIITVGSDAHSPQYVGYGFDIARELLIDSGFRYYCTFSHQKPLFNKIV